jgi:uroporphyrinogen-III synthase
MQQYEPAILCTGPVDETILRSPEFDDAAIDVIPLTQISLEITPDTEKRIKQLLHERSVVVFTSNNAVRSVARFLDGAIPDWSIYCIGNTTLQLTAQYFGNHAIIASAPTASKLAEKILSGISGERFIFFCGNLRRHELPEALKQKGIATEEIIVYTTTITPVSIAKEYDAILFFSPSAATSFFHKNVLPAKTVSFVMGKTTEDTIRGFADNEVVTAKEPDKKLLIKLAIDHILEKRKAADAATKK